MIGGPILSDDIRTIPLYELPRLYAHQRRVIRRLKIIALVLSMIGYAIGHRAGQRAEARRAHVEQAGTR